MSDGGEIFTLRLPPEGVDRLDAWLAAQLEGFSRARIQGLVKAGRVALNGKPVGKSAPKTHPGDEVTVSVPPPVPAVPEPQAIPLDVLHEDDDVIVLNKPAGLVVHPAPGHLDGTLVNALLAHCPSLSGVGGVARPGLVHRLDRDTSGVMVVAKSQRAMDALTKAFASRTGLAKTYLAVVHGAPSPREGRIENLIGRSPRDRKKMAVVERNGKPAVTDYRVVGAGGDRPGGTSLVECRILTGRTHQIRVHLASIGCPVAGDEDYGRAALDRRLDPPPARQLLHAWKLALRHPATGEALEFTAPPPPEFERFLR